jgi:uncharacterized protein YbcI
MTDEGQTLDEVRAEIVREISRVHEEAYGAGISNVEITMAGDLVAVAMDVELSPAERTLADAGNGEAVRFTREEFQKAIKPTFCALVERATGRRVVSFASRMVVEPPWSAEIFRLAPED